MRDSADRERSETSPTDRARTRGPSYDALAAARPLTARGGARTAHALQRLAGNRAVTTLVSRQVATAPGEQEQLDGGARVDDAAVPAGTAPTARAPGTTAAAPPPPPAGGGTSGRSGAPARTRVTPTRVPVAGGDSSGGLPSLAPDDVAGPEDAGREDAAAPTQVTDSSGGPSSPPGATTHPPGFWSQLVTDLGGPSNAARDALEMLRPIPGWGAFPGLAADTIGMIGDLNNFQGVDQPFTLAVTAIRDVVAMTNNLIGSLSGTVQTVQDVATASVVGVEVDAVTAPAEEYLKVVKVWLDGIQLSLDVIGAAAAAYNASHAPRGSAELAKSNTILQTFEANILGDVVSTVIDAIDLSTAGFANGDNLKGLGRWIYSLLKAAGPIGRAVVSTLNGWFGVHGGGHMPTSSGSIPEPEPTWHPAAPAGAVQRLAGGPGEGALAAASAKVLFADLALAEVREMRSSWQLADSGLTIAVSMATNFEQRVRALATQANDGRDPFIQIRDNAHHALDGMNAKIAELTDLGQIAGSAQDKSRWIVGISDQVLGAIDGLRLPEMHVPRDSDQGVVAGVLNAGADLADRALQAALTPARRAVDQVRESARQPVLEVRGHADEVAEFGQFLQQYTQEAIGTLTARIGSFSAGLAHVDNGEQFIDLLLHQVTEMLGIPGGAGLDDARQAWAGIGATIGEGEAWVQQFQGRAQRELARLQAGAAAPGTNAAPDADAESPAMDPFGAAAAPAN